MRRRLATLTLAGLVMATGACGGDSEDAEEGRATSSTTAPVEENGTTSSTQLGEDGGSGDAGGSSPSDGPAAAGFPKADATDTAKIGLRDFVFVDMPATVTGPRLRIEVTNNGPSAHEIVVRDESEMELARIQPILNGKSAELSLELPAGTYQLRCEIALSATRTHADEGMVNPFAVT